ncbi:hypothetical protein K9M41_00675 [Candidatus Gracilibacteria bacterium]|nr:hypothetical protein [Candidatus Gracilibacteria bacterium]
MKKLILLLSPFLFFGCSTDELKEFLGEVHDIPAQTAIDEITKLVKSESLFRSPRTQYEYDSDSLEDLFIRNEYEILVKNHRFFYCFDSSGRNLEGVPTISNFLVLSFGGPSGVIQGNGTPAFRRQIKALRELSSRDRRVSNFESVLDIEDGKCFEIQTHADTSDISAGEILEDAFNEFEDMSPEQQEEKINELIQIIEEIPEEPLTINTKRVRLKR